MFVGSPSSLARAGCVVLGCCRVFLPCLPLHIGCACHLVYVNVFETHFSITVVIIAIAMDVTMIAVSGDLDVIVTYVCVSGHSAACIHVEVMTVLRRNRSSCDAVRCSIVTQSDTYDDVSHVALRFATQAKQRLQDDVHYVMGRAPLISAVDSNVKAASTPRTQRAGSRKGEFAFEILQAPRRGLRRDAAGRRRSAHAVRGSRGSGGSVLATLSPNLSFLVSGGSLSRRRAVLSPIPAGLPQRCARGGER